MLLLERLVNWMTLFPMFFIQFGGGRVLVIFGQHIQFIIGMFQRRIDGLLGRFNFEHGHLVQAGLVRLLLARYIQ